MASRWPHDLRRFGLLPSTTFDNNPTAVGLGASFGDIDLIASEWIPKSRRRVNQAGFSTEEATGDAIWHCTITCGMSAGSGTELFHALLYGSRALPRGFWAILEAHERAAKENNPCSETIDRHNNYVGTMIGATPWVRQALWNTLLTHMIGKRLLFKETDQVVPFTPASMADVRSKLAATANNPVGRQAVLADLHKKLAVRYRQIAREIDMNMSQWLGDLCVRQCETAMSFKSIVPDNPNAGCQVFDECCCKQAYQNKNQRGKQPLAWDHRPGFGQNIRPPSKKWERIVGWRRDPTLPW
jgi:hypothetical protein